MMAPFHSHANSALLHRGSILERAQDNVLVIHSESKRMVSKQRGAIALPYSNV